MLTSFHRPYDSYGPVGLGGYGDIPLMDTNDRQFDLRAIRHDYLAERRVEEAQPSFHTPTGYYHPEPVQEQPEEEFPGEYDPMGINEAMVEFEMRSFLGEDPESLISEIFGRESPMEDSPSPAEMEIEQAIENAKRNFFGGR
jgi:hypothetical protein